MGDHVGGGGGDGLPPTIPPPEWIHNISCYSPELLHNLRALDQDWVSPLDVLKSLVILITSSLALAFNLALVVVINCGYYRHLLRPQPRYILTAMALNDIATITFVLSFGVYSSLLECWPLGQFWCQIQALLRGSFTQNSSLVLVILALERYIGTMHPFSYNNICDKKVCVLLLLISFVASVFFYGVIVLHPSGFHFNTNGLMICEPYYLSNDALILASCIFYFPTTMVLMYCYGTIFHSSKAKLQYRNVIFNTLPMLAGQTAANGIDRFMVERKRNDLASRSSAAISLTFIIAVTPWAIKQAPAAIDFFVSWLESSHSVCSPTIYWMLNPKFRRAARRFFIRKILCRPLPLGWNFEDCDEDDFGGPGGGGGGGGHRNGCSNENPLESVREKFWGEILDRSMNNLQQQQQSAEEAQNEGRFQCLRHGGGGAANGVLAATPKAADRHHQYSVGGERQSKKNKQSATEGTSSEEEDEVD